MYEYHGYTIRLVNDRIFVLLSIRLSSQIMRKKSLPK